MFHFVCAHCVLLTVSVVADTRRIGGVLHFLLLCAHYLTTSVIFGQGGERFSALQKPQARGLSGHFGALKQKTGYCLGQKPFSTKLSLFSPDFLKRHFPARTRPCKRGIDHGGGSPRYVPNKPCVERASACQARACTGAEGFILSEESVGAKNRSDI